MAKNILHIDLKTGQTGVRSYADLDQWVGGLGMGLRLWQDYSPQRSEGWPVIFTIGPFTAAFPFASHTCAVVWDQARQRPMDTYAGGRLATTLRFSGLDGLVLENRAPKTSYLVLDEGRVDLLSFSAKDRAWGRVGLPDRRSTMVVLKDRVVVDGYFTFGRGRPPRPAQRGLHQALKNKNLFATVVSGSHHLKIKRPEKYRVAYQQILSATAEISQTLLEGERACTGCPTGCTQSARGGSGSKEVLPACLVTCPLFASVYKQVPLVFSGLHALGENTPHEVLEELPERVRELREVITRNPKL